MTPAEWGQQLAADMPPLTDAECQQAARLLWAAQSESEAA